jgi:hypothetical protein
MNPILVYRSVPLKAKLPVESASPMETTSPLVAALKTPALNDCQKATPCVEDALKSELISIDITDSDTNKCTNNNSAALTQESANECTSDDTTNFRDNTSCVYFKFMRKSKLKKLKTALILLFIGI